MLAKSTNLFNTSLFYLSLLNNYSSQKVEGEDGGLVEELKKWSWCRWDWVEEWEFVGNYVHKSSYLREMKGGFLTKSWM